MKPPTAAVGRRMKSLPGHHFNIAVIRSKGSGRAAACRDFTLFFTYP